MAKEECPSCGATMEENGVDGNYKVYICSEDCEIERLVPLSEPNGDAVSVEDLKDINSFRK